MSNPTTRFFEFGSFKIDTVERVLLRNDQPVILTQKVFDLLLLLVRNGGHIVGKQDLMREIWPDTFVEEGSLTQNISVLRKALADDGHQYIQTVPRRGYRFVGKVNELVDEMIVEEHTFAPLVVEEESQIAAPTPAAAPVTSDSPNWKRTALVGGIALALMAAPALLGILGARIFARHDVTGFDVTNVTLRTVTASGTISYGVISPDGQFVVYATVDDESRCALWLQRVSGREVLQLIAPTYAGISPAAISHDNNWIYFAQGNPSETAKRPALYRMPLFGGAPRKVLDDLEVFGALSPDDRRILLRRFKASGGIYLLSVSAIDGSDERMIASSNLASDYMGSEWSPDGAKLLFIRMEQRADGNYWSLMEMPAEGGASRLILAPAQRRISFAVWADQGRGIVMSATDPVTRIPQLYYVSYPASETRRITNDLAGYTTVCVGGETILAGRVDRQSKVSVTGWPKPGPARQAIERDMADGFSWMPDNRIVYDTRDDGVLHIWIADSAGPERLQLSPDMTEERQPDVSPDGKLVAFISKRSGNVALWIMNTDGRNARRLTSEDVQAWRPRFAPDGQSIFFLMERDDRAVIGKISVGGGAPVVITNEVNSESLFDISPDGGRLAYSTRDRDSNRARVVIRSLTDLSPPAYFGLEPSYFLRWTPDGQNLAYAQNPQDKRKGQALWLQPINGGPPHEVLDVAPDLLYWIAWSRDGKQLAFAHGRFVTDTVLLSRNQPTP
jgi:Tol biopolymer transport system component/DNA-binding winged helix-turn-helix (wHTH) protein